MRRILYALVVSIIALTPVVRSQTPTVSTTKTTPTSVSTKSEPQPIKAVEDCACEPQVLREALAIVNGVRITAREIEKATGDSVRQVTTNTLLDAEANKERVSGDFAQTRDSIMRYLEQIEVRGAERATFH